MEQKPATVLETTKQGGEVRARWVWTEPRVWTERMLTALESGVKGGQWFSLIDKVYATGNLDAAFEQVSRNKGAPGIDRQSIDRFESNRVANLDDLGEQLRKGTYQPQPVRRVWIEKVGSKEKRPLGIPTVRDRIVQTALRNVLEPIFEREFAEQSYGFRPKRSAKDALRRVVQLLEAGYTYVVDADIRSYYDTIPRTALMTQIERRVSDGRVLALVQAMLNQSVMDGLNRWEPEAGTPQGAVISPLLSNIYLDPLDQAMVQAGQQMVRYADDFLILCRSEAEAIRALERAQDWVRQAGLTLHPDKTRIVDATQPGGFDFLGYHFEQGKRWPRSTSLGKFRDTVRRKTRRNSGHSLSGIISDLNRSLRGWFGYFQHSHRTTFPYVDSWVRMRLRSILRRRCGQRGRGRGADHQRWSNAFFTAHGLFSLTLAHATARQSSMR